MVSRLLSQRGRYGGLDGRYMMVHARKTYRWYKSVLYGGANGGNGIVDSPIDGEDALRSYNRHHPPGLRLGQSTFSKVRLDCCIAASPSGIGRLEHQFGISSRVSDGMASSGMIIKILSLHKVVAAGQAVQFMEVCRIKFRTLLLDSKCSGMTTLSQVISTVPVSHN